MQNPDYKFPFEKLEVWQKARSLTKQVYNTTKNCQGVEKFGMVNQMRRVSVSVCSNIAEGSSRTSNKDQVHFYQLAYSSLMELMNQVIIAMDWDYLSSEHEKEHREKVGKISRLLISLRNSRYSN